MEVGAVGEEMCGKRVTKRVRVKVPIYVDEAHVLLDDATDGTLRETPPGVIKENSFRLRGGKAAAGARSGRAKKKLFAKRPIVFQRILRFNAERNDAFFVALAANTADALPLL